MVNSWLLFIILIQLLIIIQQTISTSVFNEDHNVQKCIKSDEQLLCIQLNSISSTITSSSSSFYVQFDDTDLDSYTYTSGIITSSTLNLATACYRTQIGDSLNSITIKFYDTTGQHIESEPDLTISMKSSWSTSSVVYYPSPSSSNTNFNVWIAEDQCFEIKTGDMFIKDEFIANIDFYRTNEANTMLPSTSSTNHIISTLTKNTNNEITSNARWDTLICLPGSPDDYNTDLDYITASITITSKWTGNSYDLLYTNNKPVSILSDEYEEYMGSDTITTHFGIGEIKVKYWQSCDSACNDIFGPCWNDKQDQLLQKDFPVYVGLIILVIFIIILVMLLTAYLNHKYYYKCSDNVHWKGLAWLMIELWDWWTDVAFVVFLYLNLTIITEERIDYLQILFYSAIGSLLLTYIINIVYLVHYLQMWSEYHAPGITRLWLQEWSWFLIFLCMSFGGIHVALEFCNSLITPNLNIFTMHVPYSEMVRTRKDRLITNAICQNIPFIVIYSLYHTFYINSGFNPNASNMTLWLCLVTTILSLILSTIWAFYRRGYAQQHPLALYAVSIHFKTSFWKQYYIHSHNRICRAVQNGLKVRKSNLIILDQCSESYESMKIEARILKDTKVFGYTLPPTSSQTAKKILDSLVKEFEEDDQKGAGTMELKNFYAKHVNYGEGEYVYNHNTGVFIFCNSIKGCFFPKQNMGVVKKKRSSSKGVGSNNKGKININLGKYIGNNKKKKNDRNKMRYQQNNPTPIQTNYKYQNTMIKDQDMTPPQPIKTTASSSSPNSSPFGVSPKNSNQVFRGNNNLRLNQNQISNQSRNHSPFGIKPQEINKNGYIQTNDYSRTNNYNTDYSRTNNINNEYSRSGLNGPSNLQRDYSRSNNNNNTAPPSPLHPSQIQTNNNVSRVMLDQTPSNIYNNNQTQFHYPINNNNGNGTPFNTNGNRPRFSSNLGNNSPLTPKHHERTYTASKTDFNNNNNSQQHFRQITPSIDFTQSQQQNNTLHPHRKRIPTRELPPSLSPNMMGNQSSFENSHTHSRNSQNDQDNVNEPNFGLRLDRDTSVEL